jgi:hypothetical protein
MPTPRTSITTAVAIQPARDGFHSLELLPHHAQRQVRAEAEQRHDEDEHDEIERLPPGQIR